MNFPTMPFFFVQTILILFIVSIWVLKKNVFIFSIAFNFLTVCHIKLFSEVHFCAFLTDAPAKLTQYIVWKSSFGFMKLEDRIHNGWDNVEAGNRCSSWSRKLKAESSYHNHAHNTERVNWKWSNPLNS